MILLLDFLDDNVLISNTYGLFDYGVFANRLAIRYGQRVLRDDFTDDQIKNAAQTAIDINKQFLTAMSARIIDPFKTWGETDIYNAGTSRTDTTTPNLTDTTTPNLTDTTTPNLTQKTEHRGTITGDGDGDEKHFVNAFDNQNAPAPDNSATNHSETTNTYNNDDTTTNTGTTTTTRMGNTTVKHTGTNTVKSENSGADTTEKTGWNLQDYQLAMDVYLNFIDIVIDFVVRDILYITVRVRG